MPRQPEVHFRLKSKISTKDKKQGAGIHSTDKRNKPKSDEECLIYLQFIYSGRRLFYSFGQFVRVSDWNAGKERVKNKLATTADGKFAINDLLDNLKSTCERTYNEALKDGIPEPEILRAAMENFVNQNHSGTSSKPNLYTLANRFVIGEIKNKGRDKSKSSLQNYAAVLKHLKEFEAYSKYKVDFDTINLDFFYAYVTYLQKIKNLAVNSIAKDISILKVFMGEAVDMDYTDNLKFKHKKFSFNEEDTEHVYLKEEELHHLYQFKLTNKKLEQVRDLFIFGAWVGLRISDYSNIKPENIVQIDGGYFIDITTQKTKERVIIPCNPVVLEIFEKYSHNANKLPKTISDQKFNEYIKNACELAGMVETGRLSTKPHVKLYQAISSHTCRRSFATNYYLQGFPTIDLMKITTHKTERSFLKYIRVSKLDTAKRMAAHIKENWSKKLLRVA